MNVLFSHTVQWPDGLDVTYLALDEEPSGRPTRVRVEGAEYPFTVPMLVSRRHPDPVLIGIPGRHELTGARVEFIEEGDA